MSVNQIVRIIPVLKVNNRNLNQDFYKKVLGMKTLLEESAHLSLGDLTKTEKLVLEESPSMRSRRVKGPKKLARIVIRVEKPEEIEGLLAQKPDLVQLYRGSKSYAFEAVSPEGHAFLLHAEDDLADLRPVRAVPDFQQPEGFAGLSCFEVETVELHVPDQAETERFYRKLVNALDFLSFTAAAGQDLQADSTHTWDIAMIKAQVKDLDTAALREILTDQEVFVPKSDKFLLSQDPSKIELWFEA
ncbi:CppA N-terminal domain-containing protein [Streptococcus panodentis]|uniref:Proteinase n=1 Tax=Streptococcus panodentis TaxID=1581472 RepID=A0ABS5AVM6_9STRE|nr:CppA N-terminal domain-containing protein [Streptococcus panodentis]MBP2620619.1 proteinase [Streptococcus panodentis]